MKCAFCERDVAVEALRKGPNGMGLCEDCHCELMKEIEQDKAKSPVKCEVVVGVLEDGSIYFDINGNQPSMLMVDGLLKYAERRSKIIWDSKNTQAAKDSNQGVK